MPKGENLQCRKHSRSPLCSAKKQESKRFVSNENRGLIRYRIYSRVKNSQLHLSPACMYCQTKTHCFLAFDCSRKVHMHQTPQSWRYSLQKLIYTYLYLHSPYFQLQVNAFKHLLSPVAIQKVSKQTDSTSDEKRNSFIANTEVC